MLNTIERRHEIVQLVGQTERVEVSELAEQFGVSTVTIRNDLNALHEKGLLVRSHGGAVASSRLTKELTITEKHDHHHQVKVELAKLVAGLIGNDESIILDSGTTTEEVAKQLTEHQQLVVMTNGLNVAQALVAADGVEVLMTGGSLRKKSLSFYGSHAEDQLKQYHFDRLVLGVDGFSVDVGVTTHFEPEAALNREMCKVAKQVIVVTDSSKFDRKGVHRIIACEEIDVLVTDSGIPADVHQQLVAAGIEVHLITS
ncbi:MULTISPECIES: transcriptional repressor AgaR [Pseudoalteromonas]|uniref:transcriptional repressor AgaR n=1 Tax=Pseudoalteromonas TaxID=53246 RepID=UPI000C7C69FA|nr:MULTISPECIES: transcriptional repressor AgaR [Pseudoalteromonas]AUJ71649.1 Glucitol operon repressor [Pseudoalteromonas sp. NC201]MBR8845510.1 DeoR/GlpR transcriptional regulator [Pseudoalteromonas sp. JC3]MCF7514668.1 DeoR/GlpR family DNA-binding transcription regulator [Pseudoalteromonas sp. L7]MCF7526553.1 DeoR/GlpR family DNA-binding transcription regulator [Pseudoalteromonas sp. L23]MCX2766263.1 transcriptional repressor AgaR [Pseudoalteromonas sp. B530]